mmetsp:Transcript_11182/g.31047  ORF Transcript_11182/g.31047 Transcript_11182/m.31047 type:complete len:121 (+) Transcript_11182:133-495(+)
MAPCELKGTIHHAGDDLGRPNTELSISGALASGSLAAAGGMLGVLVRTRTVRTKDLCMLLVGQFYTSPPVSETASFDLVGACAFVGVSPGKLLFNLAHLSLKLLQFVDMLLLHLSAPTQT